MNEKDLFEKGCFLPEWATDIEEEEQQISVAYSHNRKDLQTLLSELDNIKDRIQEIQAKQWHLAKLIHFNQNELARD